LVRIDCGLHLLHLIEQSCLLFVATGCVNDDNLVLLLPEKSNPLFGDFHRVSFFPIAEEGTLNLGRVLL
jgi:hypothetical protein